MKEILLTEKEIVFLVLLYFHGIKYLKFFLDCVIPYSNLC